MKRCTHCEKRIWFKGWRRFNREDRQVLKLYYGYDDYSDVFIHRKCWKLLEIKRKMRLKGLKEFQKYKIEFQQHKGHGYAECSVRGCKWHEHRRLDKWYNYKSNPM